MEDEISVESDSEASEKSNEQIEGDDDLRQMAIPQENEDEKET